MYVTYSVTVPRDTTQQEIQDVCELLEKYFQLLSGSVKVTVEAR